MNTPKTLKEAIYNALKDIDQRVQKNSRIKLWDDLDLFEREDVIINHIKDRLAQDFTKHALKHPEVIELWTKIFLSPDLSKSSSRTPSKEIPADLSGSLTQSQTERK